MTRADGGSVLLAYEGEDLLTMSLNNLEEYWVPEHVKDYLRKLGFVLPLDDMESWIRSWGDWIGASGGFFDYRDKDDVGACTRSIAALFTLPRAYARSGALCFSTRTSRWSLRTRYD